jgi:hypothetical protein
MRCGATNFNPQRKAVSMQWKHWSSACPRKFKSQPTAEKFMLTIFFDINGLLILVFKDHDITINTQHQQQEKSILACL